MTDKIKGKIQACTEPKEYQGKLQIGFRINDTWYNITGDEAQLKVAQTMVAKGNEIEFDYDSEKKTVDNFNVLSEGESWQDDIIDFNTLMKSAHEKAKADGLMLNITSDFIINKEEVMLDVEKKFACFKANVVLTNADGKEVQRFEGHGDATEENVTGDFIKPHFIRMAETRAIARALRWYTNNAGKAAEEEKQ